MSLKDIKALTATGGWIDFDGQIAEIKETKVRTQKQRQMTKVKLKDSMDEIGVWLYTDTQMVSIGQHIQANGMLQEYNGQRYIDYATIKSLQTPQALQQPQQGHQQPAGAANNKDMLICSQVVYKGLIELEKEGKLARAEFDTRLPRDLYLLMNAKPEQPSNMLHREPGEDPDDPAF